MNFTKGKRTYYSFSVWFPMVFIMLLQSTRVLDPVLVPKFIFFSIFLVILAFVLLLEKKNDPFKGLLSNAFFWIYPGYVLISGISLVYTTALPDGIFEFMKILLLGCAVLLITALFKHDQNLNVWFVRGIIILNLIMVTFGVFQLAQTMMDTGLSHESMYRIKVSFAHKNILSEILLLCLPFSIYAFLRMKKWWRIAGATGSFMAFFFIIILLSRAVWLALMMAMLCAFFIWLMYRKKIQQLLKPGRKYAGFVMVVWIVISITFGIFFYAKQDDFSTLKKQTEKIVNFNYGSTKDRIQLWKKTIELVRQSPVKGSGLASWKIEILQFGNRNLRSEDQVTFYQRPHNDYLWVLAEQGLFGLMLYAGIFLTIILQILRLLKRSGNADEFIFFTMILCALTGYLTFSFFSFPKERMEHMIILSYLFAVVIIKQSAKNSSKTVKPKMNKCRILIPVLILLFAAVFVGIMRYKGESRTQEAFIARRQSNPIQTIQKINLAENILYKMDPFSTPLSWYRGSAYYNLNDYKNALLQFQKAYAINPNHIHVLNNLGTCHELFGRHDTALVFYNKALKISPDFGDALLNKCAVLYNMNKKDSAYATLRMVKPSTNSNRYAVFLKTLLIPKIDNLISEVEETEVQRVLQAISNSPEWYTAIHKKSVKEERAFENQLIIDAVYTLQNLENKINEKEAERLTKKYNMF